MQNEICQIMSNTKVLNSNKIAYPLFQTVLYGDKLLTAKLSKRLSCAIKYLPIRLQISYEYSTQKAIENGVSKDPTLIIDNKIFIEGLVQTEDIIEIINEFIEK